MFYYNNNRQEFEAAITSEFKIPSSIKKYISNIQVLVESSPFGDQHPIKTCDILFELKDNVLHRKDVYYEIMSTLGDNRYYFEEHTYTQETPTAITRCHLECSNRAKLFNVASLFTQRLLQDSSVEMHSINLKISVLDNDEHLRYDYYESRAYHLVQLLMNGPSIKGDIYFDANISIGYDALMSYILYAAQNDTVKIKFSGATKEEVLRLAGNLSRCFKNGEMYLTAGAICNLIEIT